MEAKGCTRRLVLQQAGKADGGEYSCEAGGQRVSFRLDVTGEFLMCYFSLIAVVMGVAMSRQTLVLSPLDLISSHTLFSHLQFLYPLLSPGILDGKGVHRRERALLVRLHGVSTFSTWSPSPAPPHNHLWSWMSGTLALSSTLGQGKQYVPHLRLV